ncbi:CDP-alcohol phosphatidyltransferase family protein [Legionella cardiaca]|uniref:CDP-alcohol phosphatidyltransferase family protein n=1 Tax=Legionella cardiaca TaxID=1071983 RepID=A0ABY8AUJ0_9GAMM|nr:CDP-alcohol phosphatidyltransferase family protein [Legionella cardiaca]WED42822.1 CDP-alcohol phosphatidyltransferase family protein [Legionella cardiaca]
MSPMQCVLIGECSHRVFGLKARERIIKLAAANHLTMVNAATLTETDSPTIILDINAVFDEHFLSYLRGLTDTQIMDGDVALACITSDIKIVKASIKKQKITDEDNHLIKIPAHDIPLVFFAKQLKKGNPLIQKLECENIPIVEKKLYRSTYKGVTDLCTKYFWYHLAFYITRVLAKYRIKPNTVTFFSLIFCTLSPLLIMKNHFVLGLGCAWLMMILDTVDGKLARLTVTSSKFGDYFDHGMDLIHPPFWYLAWGIALSKYYQVQFSEILNLFYVIVIFYILGRLAELFFKAVMGIKMFLWQKFDARFRLVMARRNTNFLLLTLSYIAGYPVAGFYAVYYWTIISVLIQYLRLGQAFQLKQISKKKLKLDYSE